MTSNKITSFSFTGITQVGCLFVLIFSVISFLEPFYWRLELLVHFRLQYLVLSIAFITYFFFIKNKTFSTISTVIFLINAFFIIPSYTNKQSQKQKGNPTTIKLFHSNVLTSNTQHLKLIKQIYKEQSDVVILQEVDKSWMKSLTAIKTVYPFSIERPRSDNFGIALYSKIPIENFQVHFWTDLELPSIEVKFVFKGASFNIIAIHPLPPVTKEYYDKRNAQIKVASERIKKIDGEIIVIGDLNTTIWSEDYAVFESGTGLTNASKGFGIIPTWPTNLLPLMIPIDHCLISKKFKVITIKSGDDFGSDHLPLIVELELY